MVDLVQATPGAGPTPGARLRAWAGERSAAGTARRFAGFAYLLRVANAGIAFLTQILLARWMGAHEFGIYVYVWTWVVLLGTVTNLGFASSPQRFIPLYLARGETDLLRGYLAGGRWMAVGLAAGFGGLAALGLGLFASAIDPWLLVPLFLGLACLPLFVLTEVQEGIARTYDWPGLAMAPTYLIRPLLLVAILAGLHGLGWPAGAVPALAAAFVATAVTAVGQQIVLDRRLRARVAPGPRTIAPVAWLRASFPQFLVEGFYLSLTYCDVIILERFVAPDAVGVYYAATKLASLIAFVFFAVAAASAHRFAEYGATGERAALETFLRATIRWTFLPSLAMAAIVLALGRPLLSLFGPGFEAGYGLLAMLSVGLLARASIGPVEKLLTMLGHQSLCAAIYAGAFAVNIGLCLALVPSLGPMGAATATSAALALESVALFFAARRRLGLHTFAIGGRSRRAPAADAA